MTRPEILRKLFSVLSSSRLNAAPLLKYLDQNGFYTQVASTGNHGNYCGGLFDHSLAVTQKLLELTHGLKLTWQSSDSPYIIGMFHDLCKIDEYRTQFIAGQLKIEKIAPAPGAITGHGEKSVKYLEKFIPLTAEEKLCIRFHMGPYIRSDWDAYDQALKRYENVLWTHTADMYASRLMR